MNLALAVGEETQRFFAEYIQPWQDYLQAKVNAEIEEHLLQLIDLARIELSPINDPPVKTGKLQ